VPTAISVDIDTSELRDMFNTYTGPEFAYRLAKAMDKSLAKIAADASEIAPRDTGLLASSMAYTMWPEGDDLWGVVYSPLKYAPAVEWGRTPGEAMPPKGALLGWMKRHGIPDEYEDNIRFAIHARGTIPQPFLTPAFDANVEYMLQSLVEALDEEV